MIDNTANIKLQSIPAFFANARATHMKKCGYGCNFFSLALIKKKDITTLFEIIMNKSNFYQKD